MSDPLIFLAKARPDAMGHYFAFLKQCGTRLDPKTRNLISVITKVHAQTERGLKQYVNRALREGCTPEEILDALLMAFPALGLARIVWAIDVLMRLQVPGFSLAALEEAAVAAAEPAPEPAWHDLMATKDLAVGAATQVECDGKRVFVSRGRGTWQVWDGRCPHQATHIPHLALQGHTLTCPKHHWVFDIRTGACTAEGDRPLNALPHKVARGRLLARW